MEILLNAANDIYVVNFDTVGKTLTISGINNFPVDYYSLREVYNTTHAGYCGLPTINQFAWFRSNGLPVFVWGLNNLPAGSANGDTLNVLLDISEYQAGLSLSQKFSSAVGGSPGTFVSGETPSGTINSTNKSFTLANTPIKGTVVLIYNPTNDISQFLQFGIDFTVSGNAVTLINAPVTGSSLLALYYR